MASTPPSSSLQADVTLPLCSMGDGTTASSTGNTTPVDAEGGGGGSSTTPGRCQQSVATQHDPQSYAQWFYNEFRSRGVPTHLPPINVRLSKKRTKAGSRNGGEPNAVAPGLGGADATTTTAAPGLDCDDTKADATVLPASHDAANDFTPSRRGVLQRQRPVMEDEASCGEPDTSGSPCGTLEAYDDTGYDDEQEEEEVSDSCSTTTSATSMTSEEVVAPHNDVPNGLVDGSCAEGGDASDLLQDERAGSRVAADGSTTTGVPSDPLDATTTPRDPSSIPSLTGPPSVGETPPHSSGAVGAHVPNNSQQQPPQHQQQQQQRHPLATGFQCNGNVAMELEAYVVRRLQLRPDEQKDRNRYILLIERIVQNVLGKRATVSVHGSFATGLALQSSDIDVIVANYEPMQPLVAIERVGNALYALDSYEIPDLSSSVLPLASPPTIPEYGSGRGGSTDMMPSTISAAADSEAAAAFPSEPSASSRIVNNVGMPSVAGASPLASPSSTPTTGVAPTTPVGLFENGVAVRLGHIVSVQTIVATRVPVIKVRENMTGHRCDISFGGGEPFPSMELTKNLLQTFHTAKPLLLLMKHFVKKMLIGESEPGGMTSFPLYLLALHFYQHGLPMVHQLRQGGTPVEGVSPPATSTSRSSSATHGVEAGGEATNQRQQLAGRRDVEETLRHAFTETEHHQGHIASTSKTSPVVPVVTPGGAPSSIASAITSFMFDSGPTALDADSAPQGPSSPVATPSPQAIEAASSTGQVVLDFCVYYSYLFDYEHTGIHFQLDGTSSIVEKPLNCRARGQHLHMTSPFDQRFDITARMAHTREFQLMCHGVANILSMGTLTNLLAWISPETMGEDIGDVYQYLQAQYPQLHYHINQAPHHAQQHPHHQGGAHYGGGTHGYVYGYRHHNHPRHSHPSGGGGVVASGAQLQVQVGRGGSRHPHASATSSPPPPQHEYSTGAPPVPMVPLPASTEVNASVSRSPPLAGSGMGYVNPFPRSNTPTAQHASLPYSSGGGLSSIASGVEAPPYSHHQHHHALASPHAVVGGVTTGTMTTVPQAPPLLPPPINAAAPSGRGHHHHHHHTAHQGHVTYHTVSFNAQGNNVPMAASSDGRPLVMHTPNTALGGSMQGSMGTALPVKAGGVAQGEPVGAATTASQPSPAGIATQSGPTASSKKAKKSKPNAEGVAAASPLTPGASKEPTPPPGKQKRAAGGAKPPSGNTSRSPSSGAAAGPALSELAQQQPYPQQQQHRKNNKHKDPVVVVPATPVVAAPQAASPPPSGTPSPTVVPPRPSEGLVVPVTTTAAVPPKYIPPFKRQSTDHQE